ncbi:MAG: hypothetical protein ABR514_04375 [Chthoniobacterales bacterium]
MLKLKRLLLLVAVIGCRAASPAPEQTPSSGKAAVDQLIPWLLSEDRQLRGIPFGDVIEAATGKKVLPFDSNNEADERVLKTISAACEETLKRLNAPDSPIQRVERINEVSSYFEDTLRELLNSASGLNCNFAQTAEGRVQRAGYPDLRIVDLASSRVFYLDPKLYAAGSRDGSFRTFYFEPKIATNKVRDDAVHFIAGFEHQPRENRGWKFTRWDIADLAHFKVKLKAEFQGSNADIYRPEAIVATSVGRDSNAAPARSEPTK